MSGFLGSSICGCARRLFDAVVIPTHRSYALHISPAAGRFIAIGGALIMATFLTREVLRGVLRTKYGRLWIRREDHPITFWFLSILGYLFIVAWLASAFYFSRNA